MKIDHYKIWLGAMGVFALINAIMSIINQDTVKSVISISLALLIAIGIMDEVRKRRRKVPVQEE